MNKFIHVGNVPYGESEVIELDYFQLKIKDFKFDLNSLLTIFILHLLKGMDIPFIIHYIRTY